MAPPTRLFSQTNPWQLRPFLLPLMPISRPTPPPSHLREFLFLFEGKVFSFTFSNVLLEPPTTWREVHYLCWLQAQHLPHGNFLLICLLLPLIWNLLGGRDWVPVTMVSPATVHINSYVSNGKAIFSPPQCIPANYIIRQMFSVYRPCWRMSWLADVWVTVFKPKDLIS